MKKITKRIVALILKIIEEKKGKDILVLDLRKITTFCDFFVICTGTSTTHIQSIAEDIEKRLKEKKVRILHIEGTKESGWILLDYGSVIIHIFDRMQREYYKLEKLWADAKIIYSV